MKSPDPKHRIAALPNTSAGSTGRYRAIAAFVSKYRWPLSLIGLPLMVAALYYAFLASDQYVSEGHFIVRQDSLVQAPQLDLGALVGNTNSAQRADALLLKAFIESQDMLSFLNAENGFREHYQSSDVDWLSRLPAGASREKLYAYYLGKVRVTVDDESSIVHVEMRAFGSEYSRQLLKAIASHSEIFVNGIGQALAREQMTFIQTELDRSYERMRKASNDLLALQNRSSLLSPEAEVQSVAQIIGSLEAELAKQRTEVRRLGGFLNAAAPEIVAARNTIAALERQIQQERDRQVGSGKGALNALSVKYQEAQMTVKLATDIYQSTLTALETVRLDASRKVKYLVTVSEPSLPETAKYPRRIYVLLTMLVVLVVLYGIGKLIVATIEDHRE